MIVTFHLVFKVLTEKIDLWIFYNLYTLKLLAFLSFFLFHYFFFNSVLHVFLNPKLK